MPDRTFADQRLATLRDAHDALLSRASSNGRRLAQCGTVSHSRAQLRLLAASAALYSVSLNSARDSSWSHDSSVMAAAAVRMILPG